MKQVVFNELGYFTESQIEAIKDELDMASYMSFNVSSSNCAGNRTLIVSTDYEAGEEEIKNMFLHCALSSILQIKKSIILSASVGSFARFNSGMRIYSNLNMYYSF